MRDVERAIGRAWFRAGIIFYRARQTEFDRKAESLRDAHAECVAVDAVASSQVKKTGNPILDRVGHRSADVSDIEGTADLIEE